MPQKITIPDFAARLAEFTRQFAPPGLDPRTYEDIERITGARLRDRLYLRWRVGNQEASLELRLKFGSPRWAEADRPAGPILEFGWPSTHRTLADAVAAVNLYSQIIKFGAALEGFVTQFHLPEE